MERMSNLELWRQHGEHLLVVQPFMDNLIVRGEGCYLIDAEGNRILDLAAGQFCSILGHNHPQFVARLQAQVAEGIHLGDQYVSPKILLAAKRLAEVAPGRLNKVIFLSTGSEANEFAMRIAKVVTGRTGMLAFTRGYYGISLATRTLSSISDHPGSSDFQPAPINQFKLLTPTCNHCPIALQYPGCKLACLEVSIETLGEHAENVAAVILESVISAGGMIFPPAEYLHELHARAKRMGALLIVDEAQTGFGRTGRWFDIEHAGIEPDILVVSKTAGNGYPAAAVIVSDAVAEALEQRGFSHLSSHQNDPLAVAAVHAVIDIVEQEGLVAHSDQVGRYFIDQLKGLQHRHPLISEVRGRGLMIGVELAESAVRTNPQIAFHLAMLCERRGLHLTFSYYEPVIRIIPALTLAKNEIDFAIGVLDEVLGLLARGTIDIASLLPANVRSGPYVKRMSGRDYSPLRLAKKMWHTSPQQWLEKLKSLGGK
jgi:4-aminobutyrate aminotransferase-like enzyme